MSSFPFPLYKYSGAGNTFVLIDGRTGSAFETFRRARKVDLVHFSRELCSPATGLGTDGFLVLGDGQGAADFTWEFYNDDGSTAEMCGNAARCATRFCIEKLGWAADRAVCFQTTAGLVRGKKESDGLFTAEMTRISSLQTKELVLLEGAVQGTLVNTGVPHFVLEAEKLLMNEQTKIRSKALRGHASLGPAGANVTWLQRTGSRRAAAVTFERGVENFTQACGTGAVAAAAVLLEGRDGKAVVNMPGGELTVSFEKGKAFLTGPAELISASVT